jgi:hypothetical protein
MKLYVEVGESERVISVLMMQIERENVENAHK